MQYLLHNLPLMALFALSSFWVFGEAMASTSLVYYAAKYQVSKEAIIEFVDNLRFPVTLFYNRKYSFPFIMPKGEELLKYLSNLPPNHGVVARWLGLCLLLPCVPAFAYGALRQPWREDSLSYALLFMIISTELFFSVRFGKSLK
jgi:hypothetical protein